MANLGVRGDGNVSLGGNGVLPGSKRRRKPMEAARVAARVKRFCERDVPPAAEGVAPLNPGFFQLERMRTANVAATKLKSAKRGKVRGK